MIKNNAKYETWRPYLCSSDVCTRDMTRVLPGDGKSTPELFLSPLSFNEYCICWQNARVDFTGHGTGRDPTRGPDQEVSMLSRVESGRVKRSHG